MNYSRTENDRLEHDNLGKQHTKSNSNLLIRNILNIIFIIVSIIAMVCVVYSQQIGSLYVGYGIGLFAILIKMVEIVFRMPGLRK